MADEPEQQQASEHEDAGGQPAADAPDAAAAEAAGAAEAAEAPQAKAEKRRRKDKASADEPAGAGEQPQAQADAPQPPAQSESSSAEAAGDAEPGTAADAQPVAQAPESAEEAGAEAAAGADAGAEETPAAPRAKPEVPGAHLEVDIVPEGVDPLGRERPEDPYSVDFEVEEDVEVTAEEAPPAGAEEQEEDQEPIVSAAIDLAAGARYRATGKRKTAVARVILRPGAGSYTINGRTLAEYFPRSTLQRNIAQPLEAVGYQERMDVVARLHGGGVSSQAGALRHGISRALLEADPNLRGELKRRGFLTRDSRVKERKKAGLKKARKRPQFSKR
jgi:small subunit ribosomal protein S9